MKIRIFLYIISFVMSATLHAQDLPLKFKGVPVGGDYNGFVQKLMQNGFSRVDSSADATVLTGGFMGSSNVNVMVYSNPESETVYALSALVETGDVWPTIESQYHDVVNMYEEKYGVPTWHSEKFSVDVNNDDHLRESALRNGQCNYKYLWKAEGGHILLRLTYFENRYYVVCDYINTRDYRARRQAMIKDI